MRSFFINENIHALDIDNDGNIYSGTDNDGNGTLLKLNEFGEKVWEYDGHYGIVFAVAVTEDGDVYSGSTTIKKYLQISLLCYL